MKALRFFLPIMFAPLMAVAAPMAFTFETGELPDSCELDSGLLTSTKHESVTHGRDENRPNGPGVCITGDEGRGGVTVREGHGQKLVMDEPLKSLTLAIAYRSNPVSASPVFVERMVRSSSSNPGFFRFRAQRNGGDDHERRGTLRFTATAGEGKGIAATSTIAWSEVADAWNWVGLVFNDGKVTFYLNGEVLGDEVETELKEIPGAEAASHFVRAGYGFIGAFDDLVILPNKALTPDEMRQLYLKGPSNAEVKSTLR